jgi:hypothetical protein
MDDNFDYVPIRRSDRLMTIRARVITKQTLPFAHTPDKFATIQKRTGNTVKKGSVSINTHTQKFVCGSHSKKCYACSPSQKPLIGRRQKLREVSKHIIDETIYNDFD